MQHDTFDILAVSASLLGCVVPVVVFALDRILSSRHKFMDNVGARLSKIETWITAFTGSSDWK